MTEYELKVDFWNVGQGDCSVITLPNGNLIVIDTGPRGSPLVEWLREGHRSGMIIEALVLTHNDSDHAGSLAALVTEFKTRIRSVWMLLDRPKSDPRFQKIFRAALEGEKLGCYSIHQVAKGQTLWAGNGYRLRVVHPSFSEAILAAGPNDSSGVIILEHGENNLITWPGDLELRSTAEVLTAKQPNFLMGPHHGGPSDYPTKAVRRRMQDAKTDRMKEMRHAAVQVGPGMNYISVGTKNQHHHPRPGYLRLMNSVGAKVICSQLTVCCDRRRVLSERAVFDGSGALGLRSAKSGVACRGALRIYVNGGQIFEDEFAAAHRDRVTSLYRPQCLREG